MKSENCVPGEDIIRGIYFTDFDEKHERISSSVFRGPDTSVNRLRVYTLEQTFRIFKKKLHDPPEKIVWGGAKIQVGDLQEVGLNWKSKPTDIEVVQDPLPDNEGHALILNKLSKGLAKKIGEMSEMIHI